MVSTLSTSPIRAHNGYVSWVDIFDGKWPVEIDIGCGKGKLLIDRAQANPHIGFVGLDRAGRCMRICHQRAQKRSLANLAFVKIDASLFATLCIPQCRISVFHVYFSDPWPKRKHHKRRLITADFLDLLFNRLTARGLVELATDDTDFFSSIKQATTQVKHHWQQIKEHINERPFHAVKTNYELKYEAEGRAIYYLELRK